MVQEHDHTAIARRLDAFVTIETKASEAINKRLNDLVARFDDQTGIMDRIETDIGAIVSTTFVIATFKARIRC